MKKPEPILWLTDALGIYIPREFALKFGDRATQVANVSDEDWAILETGPDHEAYWDTWSQVETDAIVTLPNGEAYTVYQDGDCWLIPVGMEWDEESDWYVWKDDDDAD